jgi:hypothetical protein
MLTAALVYLITGCLVIRRLESRQGVWRVTFSMYCAILLVWAPIFGFGVARGFYRAVRARVGMRDQR